ncbi:Dipeptide transport system permease protein DppB [Serinicoccus hydrothermalis]|uniref:Dipeptide transport system permease protein DppB n=1 Tax=Serinicoccus hydrothermalis TaxID=1758689 RepID=A0A1B1NEK4_9MICO|nr:ABC transporter permease [Serinicoccus hydrothermalis]ANS79866.1 Dipeptide transport system permease protein DppB [Serinicoccus hydrothermalis]
MLLRLLHRAMVFVLSVLAASVLVFAFMRVLPGDPARVALGINASDEAVARLREQFGLDRPVVVQYLDWMRGLVTLDPGIEFISKAAIGPQIADRLQVTLILVVTSMLLAVVVAVPVGIWMAVRHRHVDGLVMSALSQVGVAIPAFLAGIVLISVFAVRLRWVPSGGWVVPAQDPLGFLRALALPAISLAMVQAAVLARYVRSAVLDVLREDYLRTARAKGLRPVQALWRHGLRNAAVPVVTVLGLQLATLLIGAVVIEQVFVIPGLGSLLLDSVADRELLTVQTVVMVLVVATLLINFLVDALYLVIDPRLRTGSR